MELDYQKINDQYIHQVDKFNRMFRGVSSSLISYENNTIELKIEVSRRWATDAVNTATHAAKSWRSFCIELKKAKKYKVHLSCLAPGLDTGGAFRITDDEAEMDRLIERLLQSVKHGAPPIYTITIEGLIEDPKTAVIQPYFQN